MQALSVDSALLRSLRQRPWHGQVHSVFERVVNLEDEDGALITLARRDLDNAPNTLIVDAEGFGSSGIARGDRVQASAGAIAIDRQHHIRVDGAVGWDAALPAYPVDDVRLRENLAIVRARIGRPPLGGAPSAQGESPLASGMTAMLELRARMVCAALSRRDLSAACAHAQAMVGLGPGLTPSGDDFLVGLFAVLQLPGNPAHCHESFCMAVIADVERHTNAISAAALKAAARGQVRECIQALLGELMTGTPEAVAAALAPVLAIGSTSGADIVAGIVAGFEVTAGV